MGQLFASHIQLSQAVSKFADLWAFRTTNSGNAIQCHFSKPTYKKRGTGKRKIDESMKNAVQCPFQINYTKLDARKYIRSRVTANDTSKDLPKVYFKVRISKLMAEHQCTLDTPTHRIAIQNSGTHVIDPEKFQTVIEDLRDDIHMKPTKLREKLKFLVPQRILSQENSWTTFRIES